ncbi:hypothetical protein Dsin_014554 [Dipteronia sinensis]|uniref:YqgF/RNase H-like domain-containing protein n=1 Tax=Dipteronia sinensis TaxID=43782 RepID=A0AAE0EA39_9ROSI|nr:hypothetical protein Dsin_014554 [Dipteronia sinensis]
MEYLKPVNFYKEIFKDILKKEDCLKPGRLLGLDVGDKYVSLAVSDWKNKTALPLRAVDRQEINMSSMADMIQSLIPEHNIVGFVFGTRKTHPIDAQTLILIEDLCKTGKFEGLKNAEFVSNQHLKFILEILNQPQDMSETIMEKCFAVSALQPLLLCHLVGVPGLYKQDGKRGLGLNKVGYCTNPSSWMQVDAKNAQLE